MFALLFWKRPGVFPVWRNSLAIMTGLAIVGFALFPLMPPRLLDEPCPDYGGECIESDLRGTSGTFGYVDTLAEFGGPWSFDSETMKDISNQYAAMPSMHIGWSTWCAVAVWPLLRRRWQRIVVFLYPLATLFCIIVTANHYWIDGLGGTALLRRRHARRLGPAPLEPEPPRPQAPRRPRGRGGPAPVDRGVGVVVGSRDRSACAGCAARSCCGAVVKRL